MISNSDFAMEYEIYEFQQECNWLTTKTGHGPNCILTSLNKRIKKQQQKNNCMSISKTNVDRSRLPLRTTL